MYVVVTELPPSMQDMYYSVSSYRTYIEVFKDHLKFLKKKIKKSFSDGWSKGYIYNLYIFSEENIFATLSMYDKQKKKKIK